MFCVVFCDQFSLLRILVCNNFVIKTPEPEDHRGKLYPEIPRTCTLTLVSNSTIDDAVTVTVTLSKPG